MLLRPHLNILLQHLVLWAQILLHVDQCLRGSVQNTGGSVVGSRMMPPPGRSLSVKSRDQFVLAWRFFVLCRRSILRGLFFLRGAELLMIHLKGESQ